MNLTNEILPDLYEASIDELQRGLEKGDFSSVDLVKAYIRRIDEVNIKGPGLRAILEINPKALEQAAALDAERKSNGSRGPLHGIPLLIKDNIATMHEEGMDTTAGSHALIGSIVPRDATVAAKLRAAGAILLAKASLSEWANFRGQVPSGFCGRGGQGTNPYYPNANPSGSSSGSGIGTAIGLAAGNQDSVGPMCRCVSDAAVILSSIVGPDPLDEITLSQPSETLDYSKALDTNGLRGVRIGVPRLFQSENENITKAFNEALEVMRELGATIIDPADFPNAVELRAYIPTGRLVVMEADFKVDLNKYLAGLVDIPSGTRTLADLIEFNKTHADLELIPPYHDDQSRFIKVEGTTQDENYYATLAKNHQMTRAEGIDATLNLFNLDCLVLPTSGFTSTPPAVAGYPLITVPLGFQPDDIQPSPGKPTHDIAPGMPFGISFIGTAFSEFKLISYAYAYEQKTQVRLKRLAYPEAIPKTQLKDVIGKD
ncbi:hypothetical protein Clacol_008981 [Clathrus columnatus]|uniref:Amidase domain-containing protein n=1 Tax=Clathrus columnatus TaxID=1419009 RepID=A0AAV5AJ97_9AGAM|nr:hypothetical protein Clacol_008981 [Clathrus columnatus]